MPRSVQMEPNVKSCSSEFMKDGAHPTARLKMCYQCSITCIICYICYILLYNHIFFHQHWGSHQFLRANTFLVIIVNAYKLVESYPLICDCKQQICQVWGIKALALFHANIYIVIYSAYSGKFQIILV